MPSIGLYSDRASTRAFTSDRGRDSCSANSRWPDLSAGKNSCRGGSNKRMQTGLPCIISNNSMKSPRCIGNRRSSTARRSSEECAKIISRITPKRSPSKNICSVRHRPMPWARKFRAVCASAGVSAFARTPMSRYSSAHFSNVWNALSSAGSSSVAVPARTSPDEPSTVITSPSANSRPSGAIITRRFLSITRSEAPTTQGRPRPRPITAAWLVIPPRTVRTALAACIPRISSGVVSRRTRIQGSLRAALACASFAENTMRPTAAPGLAAIPRTIRSRSVIGAT